ncbi:hypothetical protein C2W64_04211 [Brevibacillus laterosporus]|nr:hypothetical protein C2W64_04211 [Brevibacillus laterosporus]
MKTNSVDDTLGITWDLDSIIVPDKQEEIKGDWKFEFTLNATNSDTQLIGQSVEQSRVKVNLDKISITPMSFIVCYDQEVSEIVRNKWNGVDVELEVKDDFGNAYSGQGNGGTGSDSYNISWSKTFGKLDPNASKLIVTPHVTLRSYNSENYTSVELMGNGPKLLPLPTKLGTGKEEFVLNDIVIELKN